MIGIKSVKRIAIGYIVVMLAGVIAIPMSYVLWGMATAIAVGGFFAVVITVAGAVVAFSTLSMGASGP